MYKTYSDRISPSQLWIQKKQSAMLLIDDLYYRVLGNDSVFASTAYETICDIIEANSLSTDYYADMLSRIAKKIKE